jgi:hypothetical protein
LRKHKVPERFPRKGPLAIEDRTIQVLVEGQLRCVEGGGHQFVPALEFHEIKPELLRGGVPLAVVPTISSEYPADVAEDGGDFADICLPFSSDENVSVPAFAFRAKGC